MLAVAYVTQGVGASAFIARPPSELGSDLEGVVAPLAFLWLVLELRANPPEGAQAVPAG